MLAEAYYDNGKIEFTRNYRFKHNRFKISVKLPDEEISDSSIGTNEPLSESLQKSDETYMQKMMRRLDEIRTMPLDDSKLPELTEKQLDRIKAFELRAQMRTEQGRPV